MAEPRAEQPKISKRPDIQERVAKYEQKIQENLENQGAASPDPTKITAVARSEVAKDLVRERGRKQLRKTKERLVVAEAQSMTDSLTGLHNRRWFVEELQIKIAQSTRAEAAEGNKPLYVAFIDVDDFKRVNDTYGHQGGDEVLKLMKNLPFREEEPITRYGGEEFIQALNEKITAEEIEIVAARYNQAIRELSAELLPRLKPVNGAEKITEVTFSIGVAKLEVGDTRDSLIERADLAMKQAKARGKNAVVIASKVDGRVEYTGPKIQS